jgi:hypothetical protein
VTLDNGSNNYGSLTCESGGTVTLNGSTNYGSLTCWLYGTVTGATPIQFAIEKRTTHYTSGALDGIAGKITIRNTFPANVLYSMLGSYMTDCTVGNILTTKTIAEVAGSFDESARNVDPGITKVLAPASGGPTNYKIANSTLVGTATVPAEANTWHGTGTYGVGGTAKTPSKVGSSITNLTVGNVKKDVVIDDVTGTLDIASDNAAAIAAEYISLNTNSNKALVLSGTELTGDNGTIGPGTAAGSTTILAGSFCLGLGL